jgi:hypothetical protein
VFVGVQMPAADEAGKIARNFEKAGFGVLDLTHDELAKVHIRHLVGGKSALAGDELLYRFEFPERPGALMRFLSSMSPELEHQPVPLPQPGRRRRPHPDRPAGAEEGDEEFRAFLAQLGYRHWDETGTRCTSSSSADQRRRAPRQRRAAATSPNIIRSTAGVFPWTTPPRPHPPSATPGKLALGKSSEYPTHYDPSLLFPIARAPKRANCRSAAPCPSSAPILDRL